MKFVLLVLTMMMFIAFSLYEGIVLLVDDSERFRVMSIVCSVFAGGSFLAYGVTHVKEHFLPRTSAAWLLSALLWFIANPAFISYGPVFCIGTVVFLALAIAVNVEDLHGWLSLNFVRQFASALIGLMTTSAVLILRYLDSEMISVLSWASLSMGIAFLVAPGWRVPILSLPGNAKSFN